MDVGNNAPERKTYENENDTPGRADWRGCLVSQRRSPFRRLHRVAPAGRRFTAGGLRTRTRDAIRSALSGRELRLGARLLVVSPDRPDLGRRRLALPRGGLRPWT